MRDFRQILHFNGGLAVLHKLLQWQTEIDIFPSTLAYPIPVSPCEAKPGMLIIWAIKSQSMYTVRAAEVSTRAQEPL